MSECDECWFPHSLCGASFPTSLLFFSFFFFCFCRSCVEFHRSKAEHQHRCDANQPPHGIPIIAFFVYRKWRWEHRIWRWVLCLWLQLRNSFNALQPIAKRFQCYEICSYQSTLCHFYYSTSSVFWLGSHKTNQIFSRHFKLLRFMFRRQIEVAVRWPRPRHLSHEFSTARSTTHISTAAPASHGLRLRRVSHSSQTVSEWGAVSVARSHISIFHRSTALSINLIIQF